MCIVGFSPWHNCCELAVLQLILNKGNNVAMNIRVALRFFYFILFLSPISMIAPNDFYFVDMETLL